MAEAIVEKNVFKVTIIKEKRESWERFGIVSEAIRKSLCVACGALIGFYVRWIEDYPGEIFVHFPKDQEKKARKIIRESVGKKAKIKFKK